MIRQPPKSTLFPSPTLFRSRSAVRPARGGITAPLQAGLVLPPVPDAVADHRDAVAASGVVLERHTRKRNGSAVRSEEHTSELQSRQYLVCRLLLEKKNNSKH